MALDGKVALVTGAAKRLGRSIAVVFAESGADLVLHVHTSSGEEVARAVRARGRRAFVIRADLSRAMEVTHLMQDAFNQAGQVDILVNSAAVFFPTLLTNLTVDAWRGIIRTNLTAPFVLSLLLGKKMRAQGWGRIVQLSDWSGWRPVPRYLPYCVSKGGLNVLTHVMAKALAPQVTVNGVALGPVLVPDHYEGRSRQMIAAQTPLGRLGNVADVAHAVRFLVERGDFVTGATYCVDGGKLARVSGDMSTSL